MTYYQYRAKVRLYHLEKKEIEKSVSAEEKEEINDIINIINMIKENNR